jgi:hypothetical protein
MSEMEAELDRLMDLDLAVRCYLSHLAAIEQGAQYDQDPLGRWRDEMERLTNA